MFCSKDLECPVFAAAWNEASEESRRKTMRSTATAKSAMAASSNNCPVYACVTPLRMLLKWEKASQLFVAVQTILLTLTPLGI